jgi:hypothetical protein
VSQKKLEAQDMENNITNVSVIGRHFSKKQRFLCKFKLTKTRLINNPENRLLKRLYTK